MSGDVKQEELKKIKHSQFMRNRANSMQPLSIDVPKLAPVKNFGHGRRSNLVQKAVQM